MGIGELYLFLWLGDLLKLEICACLFNKVYIRMWSAFYVYYKPLSIKVFKSQKPVLLKMNITLLDLHS